MTGVDPEASGSSATGTSWVSGVETLRAGRGDPVTVVAHGLSETLEQSRVWASGVSGTRVFPRFRGHGGTPAPPGPWQYDDLVGELRAVADAFAATRTIGASLGAAVVLRWLQHDPDRFERVVLALPAAYDRAWRREAENTSGHPSSLYQQLVSSPPVTDPAALGRVRAPVLVIAHRDDDAHPVWVAERIAGSLPSARLETLPTGGIVEHHRHRLRELIGSFLSTR